MTEKLFYQKEYIREFEAVVEASRPGKKNMWEVVLDRTAFYPEGGGQPYDQGVLNGLPVLEVHEKDGVILHIMKEALEPGIQAHGVIDWDRRYRHMQLHSGEHLLSGLVHKHFGYDNVGFHMGKDEVTIDFNGVLSPEQLWSMELEANQMIYQNVPVTAVFPDGDSLSRMDYRSKKELTGAVRIVDIPGGDRCACCGTHVHSTGEIGIIKAISMIHYKGGVRIGIQCGLPALEDYEQRLRQNAAISRMLSAKQDHLTEAVEKMKQDCERKEEMIVRLYRELIELKISVYNESESPILIFEEDLPAMPRRKLCTALYESGKGSVVMVCSGSEGSYQYVIGSATQDMRRLSKVLNQNLNGKGGGSELMAQGTFLASRQLIEEMFKNLVSNL